jgi:hypothetical protein
MSYMPPAMVRSPKDRVKDLEVLYDDGENSWSMAKMKWDGEEAVGVRHNGNEKHVGSPQARGIPMWFILPEPIAEAAKNLVPTLITKQKADQRKALLAAKDEAAEE